jgi:chemotaxis protein MotA
VAPVKLDRMTPIAVGAALGAIILSMMMDGSNPAVLFKPAPMILVLGGTVMASAAGYLKSDVKGIKDVVKQAIGTPEHDPEEDIERMVHLAELARREGLLALEKAAAEVDDPFFRKGVELTVDGVDPEEIQDILEGELAAVRERHKTGAKFFQDMGGFSPTLGIIGTVVGLIHVLGSLNNVNASGPAIGSAFTATLWGVMMANIFWLPISNKLKRASELELHGKRMIMEGLLAVQAGNSPRMVHARLQAYLSPKDRVERARGGAEEAA